MQPRLLLDPASEASGGGGTPAPTPAPAPPPTNPAPTAPPGVPPAPSGSSATVSIPIQDMQVYLQKERELSELKAAQQRAIDEEKSKHLRLLVEKGEAEKALQQQRENHDHQLAERDRRIQELHQLLHGKEKANVVADCLAGVKFVSADAALQVRELIDTKLETTTDSAGNVLVRQKGTGRPATDYIAEWLKSQAALHFLEPTSRGGGGTGGGRQATPSPTVDRPADDSLQRRAEQLRASIAGVTKGAPGLAGTYGRPIEVN